MTKRAGADPSSRLVCVAPLHHQKAPLLLIDAAALLKTRGIGFLLTIIGGGALRSQVEGRIAANVDSMRELVETGGTGWLVAAHDPVALADALQGCLNAAAAILQALGANARERVLGDRSELAAHLLGAALRRAAAAGACNRARCGY